MTRFTTDVGRVADALPDALVMAEPDGTVTWLNDAALELLEIDARQWMGRKLEHLVHRDDLDGLTVPKADRLRVRGRDDQWRAVDLRRRDTPGRGDRAGFTMLLLRQPAA